MCAGGCYLEWIEIWSTTEEIVGINNYIHVCKLSIVNSLQRYHVYLYHRFEFPGEGFAATCECWMISPGLGHYNAGHCQRSEIIRFKTLCNEINL